MFNTWVDYPTYAEELSVVKATTADAVANVNAVISGDEIAYFQQLIRRMPIADNVLEYAVGLVGKTRPGRERATDDVNAYLSWGAGPRASQYLVVGAKVNATLNGKYSPDIEDVKAVAHPSCGTASSATIRLKPRDTRSRASSKGCSKGYKQLVLIAFDS